MADRFGARYMGNTAIPVGTFNGVDRLTSEDSSAHVNLPCAANCQDEDSAPSTGERAPLRDGQNSKLTTVLNNVSKWMERHEEVSQVLINRQEYLIGLLETGTVKTNSRQSSVSKVDTPPCGNNAEQIVTSPRKDHSPTPLRQLSKKRTGNCADETFQGVVPGACDVQHTRSNSPVRQTSLGAVPHTRSKSPGPHTRTSTLSQSSKASQVVNEAFVATHKGDVAAGIPNGGSVTTAETPKQSIDVPKVGAEAPTRQRYRVDTLGSAGGPVGPQRTVSLPKDCDGANGEESDSVARALKFQHGRSRSSLNFGGHRRSISSDMASARSSRRVSVSALALPFADVRASVHSALLKTYKDPGFYYKASGIWAYIVRSSWFDQLTVMVIALNAVWIAIDTDFNNADVLLNAECIFQFAENLFCFFFSFELFVRFMAFECKKNVLKDVWFLFDSTLVFTMLLETWLMPTAMLIFSTTTNNADGLGDASILRIARLLRLMRMARMARLLRAIPELVILIKGMVASTRSVMTTLVLLTIIMYVFGIGFAQITKDSEVGHEYFSSVLFSMYSLMLWGVLCLDYVDDIVMKLLDVSFIGVVAYLVFILLAAFTVLNMLIGILCEVVSKVASAEREAIIQSSTKEKLMDMLIASDEDGNRLMSRSDCEKLLENAGAVLKLHEIGVDVTNLADYMEVLFEAVDGKHEVELTYTEFVEALCKLRGDRPAQVCDVVDLKKAIRNMVQNQNAMLVDIYNQRLQSGQRVSDSG